jgi:Holliday junction resolvase RusA-like endonuclease
MNILHFQLPLPPSTNHLYRNVPGIGRVLTGEARQYKTGAALITRSAAGLAGWEYRKGSRLALVLTLHFADHRRRDASNTIKLIEDAIAAALDFDDSVIDLVMAWRAMTDKENPRCEVMLAVATSAVLEQLTTGATEVLYADA